MKTLDMKKMILASATALAIATPLVVSAESYTVKSGDTLSKIAQEKGSSVEKIAEKNKIANVNLITVGQILELEDQAAPAAKEETPAVETKTEEASPAPAANTEDPAKAGLSAEEIEAKEWIAQKESSGSYTATNGQYYGRYQLTMSYLNGDLSIENQEKVANQYVVDRYGSWVAAKGFWLANGWY